MNKIFFVTDANAPDYLKDFYEKNILPAFEESDCLFMTAELPVTGAGAEASAGAILSAVKNDECNYIMSLDYYPVLSLAAGALGIKYISWIMSSYSPFYYDYSVNNSWNYISSPNMALVSELREIGVEHVSFLPLAVEKGTTDSSCEKCDVEKLDAGDLYFWAEGMYPPSSVSSKMNRIMDASKGYMDGVVETRKCDPSLEPIFDKLPDYVRADIENNYVYEKASFEKAAHVYDHRVFFPHIDESIGRSFVSLRYGYAQGYNCVTDVSLPPFTDGTVLLSREEATEILKNKSKVCVCAFIAQLGAGELFSQDMWNVLAMGHVLVVPDYIDTSFLGECVVLKYKNNHELEYVVRSILSDGNRASEISRNNIDCIVKLGGYKERINELVGNC